MERFFGTDFSSVRVFDGSQDAARARARAFAQGNELHFAPGRFQPSTPGGQALLGHELAHVRQQRAGRVRTTAQLAGGEALNDDPALEREAEAQGRAAASMVRLAAADPVGQTPGTGTFAGGDPGRPLGDRRPVTASEARQGTIQRASATTDEIDQVGQDAAIADALLAAAEGDILLEAEIARRDGNARQVRQRGPIQRAENVVDRGNAPGIGRGPAFNEGDATPNANPGLGGTVIAHGALHGPNNTSSFANTAALHNQPNGGPVGATRPTDWPKFNAMLGGGRNPFVQGHALSQKLGGLGNQDNLSPFTRSLNALHRNRAEKQVINHTKGAAGKYADYRVDMVYGGNAKIANWATAEFNGLPLLKQLAGMTAAGLILPPMPGPILAVGAGLPSAQMIAAANWITGYVNDTFPKTIECTATFYKGAAAAPADATKQQKIEITNHMP